MTLTSKYAHRDISEFIQHDVVPEGLACSIGFGLMRQAVRINGDTSDHPYDARAAKRALEANRVNPFTRAPVAATPALVADRALQKEVDLFRARVLGYTRVAAYLASAGKPEPTGEALALPAGIAPHKVVAGQIVRNAFVKHLARRPVAQPVPPPKSHTITLHTESARAYQALGRGLRQVGRAGEITASAQDHAARGAAAAMAAQAVAEGSAERRRPTPQRAAARLQEINWPGFADTFGPSIAHAARDVMLEPGEFAIRRLGRLASASGAELGDILLFDRGQMLGAILEDGAYDLLLPVMPALAAGPHQTSDDGGMGIGLIRDGRASLFAGQVQDNLPHGSGAAFSLSSQGYSAGLWAHGRQHGIGQRGELAPWTLSRGRFVDGDLREGVRSDAAGSMRGTFEEDALSGWGETSNAFTRSRGLWQNGTLLWGEVVMPQQEVVLLAPSAFSLEHSIGSINYPDGSSYAGGLQGGCRQGFGALTLTTGEMHVGQWRDNLLHGLGALVHGSDVALGRWHRNGQPFELLYTLGVGEPIDFLPASV